MHLLSVYGVSKSFSHSHIVKWFCRHVKVQGRRTAQWDCIYYYSWVLQYIFQPFWITVSDYGIKIAIDEGESLGGHSRHEVQLYPLQSGSTPEVIRVSY